MKHVSDQRYRVSATQYTTEENGSSTFQKQKKLPAFIKNGSWKGNKMPLYNAKSTVSCSSRAVARLGNDYFM